MKDLKIGTKMLLGFGIVAVIMICTITSGIMLLNRIGRQFDEAQAFNTVSGYSQQVQTSIFDINDLVKQVAMNSDEADKKAILAKIAQRRKVYVDNLEKVSKTAVSPEAKQLFEEYKKTTAAGREVNKQLIEYAMQNKMQEFIDLYKKDFERIDTNSHDMLTKMAEYNDNRVKELLKSADQSERQAKIMFGLFGLASVIISVLIAVTLTRSVTRPIGECVAVANSLAAGDLTMEVRAQAKDETGQLMAAMGNMVATLRDVMGRANATSSQLAAAAVQLESTAEQIATGAEEVASQAGTVATASEEMSHTSTDIARNCTMAADASHRTAETTTTGAAVVQETITGMNIIAERVRHTSQTIETLGSRSEQIGNIVGTIEDIADQTNLLALNAAIEAARAGEQGRGFAVVADEVRALAERTTTATKEIGEMIRAIQNETQTAVKSMDEGVREVEKGATSSQKSGRALEEILNQINEVTMQINQIATASEEQTATTNEVTMNIQQITAVVAQTARGAEETAGAASSLSQLAQELQTLVRRFKLA
ncbi:methyl-accepting chemotaxis protein [Geobacter sp. FeAm09]|uniref:methyl-accepting chemotaxis protein n=1 Tax=Geobacter sp. FeAm09 TaxID=2597769 RepID=UPI0011EC70AE|nr:HAMP domain-containing methyl-accepting chemotaxis protein [Geobacter sp. FeAm09]QEM67547.1 methyl-accepting chemotaxis protein [Geobacter sp. FeAm09]